MADDPASRAAEALRAEFDDAFGRREEVAPDRVSLLAIRIGTEPYAIRLLDAGGLVPLQALVPVPSRRPELAGVTGLRGELVPVYALSRMVLGIDDPAPRWMVLGGAGAERVGLAFSTFDGHVVTDPAALRPAQAGEAAGRYVRELYAGTPARPVLDLASLVAAATARTDRETP